MRQIEKEINEIHWIGTIKFNALPSDEAKIIVATMSITAFDKRIVESPDIPSFIAPKIFVPLAHKVTTTVKKISYNLLHFLLFEN